MNTEGAIKNGQSRKIDNIRYTRPRQIKQKHNTICARHNYAQTNTNNVNTTCALLQTTGGKDEPNIVLCGNRNGEVILQILHVGFDIFVLFCEA